MEPDLATAHLEVALCHFERGAREAGSIHLEHARALDSKGPLRLASLAVVHAAGGDGGEARRLLQKLQAESARQYVSPVLLAMIHAALAENDSAFALLDKACAVKDPALISIQGGDIGAVLYLSRARPGCAPIHGSATFSGGWACTRGRPRPTRVSAWLLWLRSSMFKSPATLATLPHPMPMCHNMGIRWAVRCSSIVFGSIPTRDGSGPARRKSVSHPRRPPSWACSSPTQASR